MRISILLRKPGDLTWDTDLLELVSKDLLILSRLWRWLMKKKKHRNLMLRFLKLYIMLQWRCQWKSPKLKATMRLSPDLLWAKACFNSTFGMKSHVLVDTTGSNSRKMLYNMELGILYWWHQCQLLQPPKSLVTTSHLSPIPLTSTQEEYLQENLYVWIHIWWEIWLLWASGQMKLGIN